jgi:hypothetical protein
MVNDEILVPKIVKGRPFYKEGKYGVADALDECFKAGYEPLYMPEIADTRIAASNGDRIWQDWYISPSLRATGRGKSTNVSHKGGTEFVVYVHKPNYFSYPKNIRKAVKSNEFVNGAGIVPPEEFQKLLDLEDGENVFVMGYRELRDSPSKVIPVSDALKHPQTIPFLGGKERAEAYLEKHRQVYGDKIGIWHSDDLADRPLGRLLVVGYDYCGGGLGGGGLLLGSGRFLGVKGAEGAPKIAAPSKEQILRVASEFTAPCNQSELEQRITALYK